MLPSVDLAASSAAAETVAAAEAQAAVTATMSVADLEDQRLHVGQATQAQAQDLLDLLRFQVRSITYSRSLVSV